MDEPRVNGGTRVKQDGNCAMQTKTEMELRSEERFSEALYSLALLIREERRVENRRPRRDQKGHRSDAA